MKFKNQLSSYLIGALICFGGHAMAQDKKEEKRVKFVYMKDGEKHVFDETYTGEMSEELKSKIAKFKAEMGDTDTQLHMDMPKEGKMFFIHADGAEAGDVTGVVNAKVKQADGSIKVLERKFESAEEMEKTISAIKSEAGEQLLSLDIRMEKEEIIEVDGDMGAPESATGHVIVSQGGKIVIDEKFEGTEIPKEIQAKIDALKGAGKPIDVNVDIQATGDKALHQDGDHKVVIRKFKDGGEWAEVEGIDQVQAGDDVKVKFEGEKIIKVEVNGNGKNQNVWISQDGTTTELKEGKYEYVVEETIEGDGKTKTVTVIIQTLVIEDITEDDKDIPSNLRQSKGEEFGQSMNDLNFYPNPNNGEFELTFNLTEKGDTKVEVIDLAGKTVFEDRLDNFSGTYRNRIDMKTQPKGLYILKVAQNNHVMTKKVVLQ